MQTYQTVAVADPDLPQSPEPSSPELVHARLLGEGQKVLSQVLSCMGAQDSAGTAQRVSRVSEIIGELSGQLNPETGGELATNLIRIYGWWIDAVFDATHKKEPDRLMAIAAQMADMESTWVELHARAHGIDTRK